MKDLTEKVFETILEEKVWLIQKKNELTEIMSYDEYLERYNLLDTSANILNYDKLFVVANGTKNIKSMNGKNLSDSVHDEGKR